MGLWETNLFKFLNIFFCEKPLFSLHIIMIIATEATIIIHYCYQRYCAYIHRRACVPQCALDVRRQLYRLVFSFYCAFWGLNSGCQACPESASTHWALSLAPYLLFKAIFARYRLLSCWSPPPHSSAPWLLLPCSPCDSERNLSVVLSFASLQIWFSATWLLAWGFLRLQFSAV